ncbi:type I restriction endonuclease subunit R [Kocuria rosea]|uniref:type I restriction endonuclease subunit R n=1 Tax=Kocuria rosea TaxID=1275 RepID=UPI002B254D20|nr:type I restriction-modification enzyme R subunit C-terminal domain-containing protein [Kocuria rosea]MEB2529152.1 type I restriction-modification enzyme R subunit C-terminal domain-containing protein [Kocuria rosea]MEB2619651.1 type I restriction-modification enzyme R subunit C-terminal domain-containing protein [Kocuria rosea]
MTPAQSDQRLAAEQRARLLIDRQLEDAGWIVQDRDTRNLFAGQGIAVREEIMAPGHGRADYLLYVDKAVVGVIEAKPEGTTLSGVEWQSAMYASGLPDTVRRKVLTSGGKLPFVFEANGRELHSTNGFEPEPRARMVFGFPRPVTLAWQVREAQANPGAPTWRGKVRNMPPLEEAPLRPAQITAVQGLERSLREQRFDRSLIQMATGAGKTYTAVTLAYRLLRYGGFRRILFLVDRNNLADQTVGEFQNYRTPDDGRRFTEHYNVDKLTGAGMLGSSALVVSTIQRVFKTLRNEEITNQDDPQLDAFVPDDPVEVAYNAQLPPEAFDLVIVDEAHRSIYGVWRHVLEYFDAHVVGLTATPGKQTFAFFRQNLVSEYTYPQSVADRVNVDFDLYRIRTEISEQGGKIDAGIIVPKVDRRTRVQKLVALDEDLEYTHKQLDRAVTSRSQIRTVLEAFRDRLFTDIFPGRTTVPKTLIFAKDDAHAEEIVTTVREVFGKGNDFAAKITYQAKDPKRHLQAFRTSPTLRIAVTVDMIATGTDVKPLECVFFMRDVRSAQYFEQMKGRGARTIPSTDFQAVTPDATEKTRFVIVDAVGVTEHDFVEPPLNRVKGVSLQKLLEKASALTLTEDETATLASRLAALELQLTPAERVELDDVAGQPLHCIVRDLVDAVDVDHQAAIRQTATDPDQAIQDALDKAVEPLAASPELRQRLLELRRAHDQIIDEVNQDVLLDAYGVVDPSRARSVVDSWAAYLQKHRDEITALQLLREAKERRVSFPDIQELADRISRPPHNWTPDVLWRAYEKVEAGRVRHSDRHTITDLVSLLRFTTGLDEELVPYAEQVRERFAGWLAQQGQAGTNFTDKERWWLDRMVEVIASSAGITADDLDEAPFTDRGGIDGALRDLGDRAADYIDELNEVLTA